MVPTTLEGWTLEAVNRLLATGGFENDSFDFKEQLPDVRDNAKKSGLTVDCAAFANAAGGFLVFGVRDNRALSPGDRLVGVDAKDFPEQFGYYPSRCSPSVEWTFKQGGVSLLTGKLLHVVQIPKSWRAPHSVEPQDNTFRFPKRTNKGTEYMPISEVQAMFLGLQEKRRKLEMLRSELAFLAKLVLDIKPAAIVAYETTTIVPPVEVLQVLIGETFVLLEGKPKLLEALNRVRRLALDLQEQTAQFQRQLSLAPLQGSLSLQQGQVEIATSNNNAIRARFFDWMTEAIQGAEGHLKELLG